MMGTGDMRSDASTRDIHCSRCGDRQTCTQEEAAAYKLTHKCVWLTADQEIWMRAYIAVLGNVPNVRDAADAVNGAAIYANFSLAAFKREFDCK